MVKNNSYRAVSRKKSAFVSLSKLGFSGWAIVFLSVAILTFIGSMIFNKGRAYRSVPEVTSVTIQLLNGCGANGACEIMAAALLPGSGGLLYDIIEKGDAEYFGFEKTLVIDRRGDPSTGVSEKARAVASRLNINENDILPVKLADNLLDIDVTIIAGADYREVVNMLKQEKKENI
jgi:hypothetical protein